MKQSSFHELQKARVKRLIVAGKLEEIYDAIEKLPISGREKTVLSALTSRELVRGQIGNTVREIMEEIREMKSKTRSGHVIGIKIWNILRQLKDMRLIQTIETFPKLYLLNRELNPIHIIIYPYSILGSLYDVLPELENHRSEVSHRVTHQSTVSPSSGTYSTNREYIEMLVDLTNLAKKEIIACSRLAQTFDEFPIFIYVLGNAIERGVQVNHLFSTETPIARVDAFKRLGANVKIIEEEILRRYETPNFIVFDQNHLIKVDRYEHELREKVRFGSWCKNCKIICATYVRSFNEVWGS